MTFDLFQFRAQYPFLDSPEEMLVERSIAGVRRALRVASFDECVDQSLVRGMEIYFHTMIGIIPGGHLSVHLFDHGNVFPTCL